jgi:hypothetical protein
LTGDATNARRRRSHASCPTKATATCRAIRVSNDLTNPKYDERAGTLRWIAELLPRRGCFVVLTIPAPSATPILPTMASNVPLTGLVSPTSVAKFLCVGVADARFLQVVVLRTFLDERS